MSSLALSSSELSALITKLQRNTSTFLEKSAACENQLDDIEKKVSPIQRSTYVNAEKKRIYEQRHLQIEKIHQYLTVASSVQPIIEVDLSQNGFTKQKTLFDVLNRLAEAQLFLSRYEKKLLSAPSELKAIEALHKKTISICLDGFEYIIRSVKVSLPVESFQNEEILQDLSNAKNVCKELDRIGITDQYDLYEDTRLELIKGKSDKPPINTNNNKEGMNNILANALDFGGRMSMAPILGNKGGGGDPSGGRSSVAPLHPMMSGKEYSNHINSSSGSGGINRGSMMPPIHPNSHHHYSGGTGGLGGRSSMAPLHNMKSEYNRPSIAPFITNSGGTGVVSNLTGGSNNITITNDPLNEIWSNLIDDLPFHRGDNPFSNICVDFLTLLKCEKKLWNLLFVPHSIHAVSAYTNIVANVIEMIPQQLHPWLITAKEMDTNNNATDLLRHINIFLYKLDTVDTLLNQYDDFYELCHVTSVVSPETDSAATRALMKFRLLMIKTFMQSCTDLLKLNWDQEESITSPTSKFVSAAAGSLLQVSSTFQSKNKDKDNTHLGGITCDLHPVTSATIHCGRTLSMFSSNFYDDQLCILARESGIKVPSEAMTLKQLSTTLINMLIAYIQRLSDRFSSSSNNNNSTANTNNFSNISQHGASLFAKRTKSSSANVARNPHDRPMRELDISGHALYGSGNNDALNYLKKGEKYLFLMNNYFHLLQFLNERVLDEQQQLHHSGHYNNNSNNNGTSYMSNGQNEGLTHKKYTLEMNIEESWSSLAGYVDRKLNEAKSEFCETISYALSMSQEDMLHFHNIYHKENKTNKAKAIKAKFSLFNSGVAAFEGLRGEWRISVPLLRELVSTELRQTIVPIYTEFYRTYSQENFSKKHMSEYLLYIPAYLEKLLINYFDFNTQIK